MDKKKLEGFKKRLETRQQELRHTVSRTEQDGRSADEDATQDIARQGREFLQQGIPVPPEQQRAPTPADGRECFVRAFAKASFGECIHCGQEINAKRLEAVPWTRHCIECQEKLEQGLLEEAPK